MNGRRQRGFTLIELLVVILIIGMLLSFAPGALHRVVPGLGLKAAARDVAAVLRDARGQAIRANRETAVTIDTRERTYRPWKAERTARLKQDVAVTLTTANSERIDDTSGRIRFYPDGTSTGGRITLARDARRYDIVVDWLSGRVRIAD